MARDTQEQFDEANGPEPVIYEGAEVVAILDMNVDGCHVCRMSDDSVKNVPVELFDPDSFHL